MANRMGRAAKTSSRRCFTRVNVTTPTAPRTPLPTKFAVAEKHMDPSSPLANITRVVAERQNISCDAAIPTYRECDLRYGWHAGIGRLSGIPPLPQICSLGAAGFSWHFFQQGRGWL